MCRAAGRLDTGKGTEPSTREAVWRQNPSYLGLGVFLKGSMERHGPPAPGRVTCSPRPSDSLVILTEVSSQPHPARSWTRSLSTAQTLSRHHPRTDGRGGALALAGDGGPGAAPGAWLGQDLNLGPALPLGGPSQNDSRPALHSSGSARSHPSPGLGQRGQCGRGLVLLWKPPAPAPPASTDSLTAETSSWERGQRGPACLWTSGLDGTAPGTTAGTPGTATREEVLGDCGAWSQSRCEALRRLRPHMTAHRAYPT